MIRHRSTSTTPTLIALGTENGVRPMVINSPTVKRRSASL